MLEIKNLKKSFGSRQILNGVSFTVNDGQILCIVGPSGAGKTTLLRCITGLASADSGEFLTSCYLPITCSMSSGFQPSVIGRYKFQLRLGKLPQPLIMVLR